jgi:excisionase family DNA binding protein
MDRQYFTRPEAAEYLRISIPQLDNLAREGEIVRAKFGVGPRARVLYRLQDLDAYVEAHLETSKGDSYESAA